MGYWVIFTIIIQWDNTIQRWLLQMEHVNKYGYESIPINNTFLGGWTSILTQLFWCELQGYKVLTHPYIFMALKQSNIGHCCFISYSPDSGHNQKTPCPSCPAWQSPCLKGKLITIYQADYIIWYIPLLSLLSQLQYIPISHHFDELSPFTGCYITAISKLLNQINGHDSGTDVLEVPTI